jgi:hypothetical protein
VVCENAQSNDKLNNCPGEDLSVRRGLNPIPVRSDTPQLIVLYFYGIESTVGLACQVGGRIGSRTLGWKEGSFCHGGGIILFEDAAWLLIRMSFLEQEVGHNDRDEK